jgi:hypothetical protein
LVLEGRARAFIRELHLRDALRESRRASVAFEAQGIGGRLDDILDLELAAKARAYRTDRGGDDGGVLVCPGRLQRLAARNRPAQHGRIVERAPRHPAFRGEHPAPAQLH